MNDLAPKFACLNGSGHGRLIGTDRKMLNEFTILQDRAHEVIGNFYRNVGAGNLSGFEFGIDKMFRIGMNHRNAEHQRSATAFLGNFPG